MPVPRRAGRRGRVYLGLTNGAVAVPMAYRAQWGISFTQDPLDVSAMGDTNKQYVLDLADVSGTFSGFDDGSNDIFTAATDGLSRRFYLYPDTSVVEYYFGEILLSQDELAGGIGNAVTSAVSWVPSSNINHIAAP